MLTKRLSLSFVAGLSIAGAVYLGNFAFLIFRKGHVVWLRFIRQYALDGVFLI